MNSIDSINKISDQKLYLHLTYFPLLTNKHWTNYKLILFRILKMLGSRKICNLNPILYSRLIFGYSSKLGSPKLRILSKLYVIIIVASITSVFVTQAKLYKYVPKWLALAEYLIYVTHSFLTEDEKVLSAFKSIAVIDTLPCAKKFFKRLEIFLVTILVWILVFRLASAWNFCYNFYDLCFFVEPFGVLATDILMMAMDLRHMNLLLLFSLLCVRVKIFKTTLECNGFGSFPTQRFSPRKYVFMYEKIVDSLEFKNHGMNNMVRFIRQNHSSCFCTFFEHKRR